MLKEFGFADLDQLSTALQIIHESPRANKISSSFDPIAPTEKSVEPEDVKQWRIDTLRQKNIRMICRFPL